MLFSGEHGQVVELSICGYERPFTYAGDYDANWLRVLLRISSEQGRWQAVSPCLLTWELAELSEWFEHMSRTEPVVHNPLAFLEPNLSFALRPHPNGGLLLRIELDLEFCLPGVEDGVECLVNLGTLRQAAEDLQQQLRTFPIR